jgi:hypothetical protein
MRGMLATIRFSLLSSRQLYRKVKVKVYKTIILLVVLHGCQTWSVTLRKEHILRILRRIFAHKRDKVTSK